MNYFDSAKGANTLDLIAHSLVRIADALEENNRLLNESIQSDGKRVERFSSDTGRKTLSVDEIV